MSRKNPRLAFALAAVALLVGSAAASSALAARGAARTARALNRGATSALNYDLQTADGPLSAAKYRQLKSLLLYLQPDIAVLHNLRASAQTPRGAQQHAASLARSLSMYYAFEPAAAGADFGSALLSRFPITSADRLTAEGPGGGFVGLRAEVRAGNRTYDILVVRPGSGAAAQLAVDAVSRAVQADPHARRLVFASFDPDAGADAAFSAWREAGLLDPAAALSLTPAPTYPRARPAQRLDYILVSGSLQTAVRGTRVVRGTRLRELGDHLPVEVSFAY